MDKPLAVLAAFVRRGGVLLCESEVGALTRLAYTGTLRTAPSWRPRGSVRWGAGCWKVAR